MPDRLEVIQLAIELRDAAKAVSEMACDTRIPLETLAAYLEAELRPDYKALRKALKEPVPEAAGESESPLAWVRPDYRALREHPEPQAGGEPALNDSEEWEQARAFASRMQDQRRAWAEGLSGSL